MNCLCSQLARSDIIRPTLLRLTRESCQEHIFSKFSMHSMSFNVSFSNPLLSFNTNLHRFRRFMWAFRRSNFCLLRLGTLASPRISLSSKSRRSFCMRKSGHHSYSQEANVSQTLFFSLNFRPYLFERLAVSAKVSEIAARVERTPGPTFRQSLISKYKVFFMAIHIPPVPELRYIASFELEEPSLIPQCSPQALSRKFGKKLETAECWVRGM